MTHSRYPHAPGFRKNAPETSREAAESVVEEVATIRKMVFAAIAAAAEAGCTGDDVAEVLGLTPIQTRSRISELGNLKQVVDSGRRAKLPSGRSGVVWVLAQYGPPPVDDGQLPLPVAA